MTVPGTSLAYGVCSWKSPRTWKDQIIHREKADAMNKTPVMKNGCDLGGCSAILVYGASSYKELTFFSQCFSACEMVKEFGVQNVGGQSEHVMFSFPLFLFSPQWKLKGIEWFPQCPRAEEWKGHALGSPPSKPLSYFSGFLSSFFIVCSDVKDPTAGQHLLCYRRDSMLHVTNRYPVQPLHWAVSLATPLVCKEQTPEAPAQTMRADLARSSGKQ